MTRRQVVRCEVCDADVDKSHFARHVRSQMHQRLMKRHWTVLSSDEEFTRFLRTIKVSSLRGYERRLYRYYRGRNAV